MRNPLLVCGDQLDAESAAFNGFDPQCDCVWMAEADEESLHVPSHEARSALFFSAMRHYAAQLRDRGWRCHYRHLDDEGNTHAPGHFRPVGLVMVQPGDWPVQSALVAATGDLGLPLEIRADRHLFSDLAWLARYAAPRKLLRPEYFYRDMRREHRVLMEDVQPVGGAAADFSEGLSTELGLRPYETVSL